MLGLAVHIPYRICITLGVSAPDKPGHFDRRRRLMWFLQTEVLDVFIERVVIVMPLRLNMGICPTRDDHLLSLTESTGMLQHATFAIPNYRHGYCMDDNQDCWASDEGIWLPYADDSKEPPGSDWKTCFIEAAGLGSAVGSYSINHNGM
jgi:hypothetical protein